MKPEQKAIIREILEMVKASVYFVSTIDESYLVKVNEALAIFDEPEVKTVPMAMLEDIMGQ